MLDGKLKKGVTITNFGYGDDHIAEFLTEISKSANGNYAYIKNPDDALTAFAVELGGLLSCYAQDIVFNVKPKGDVKIKEVVSDLDVEEVDGSVNISINDIYSEETKNIVLELDVPEQSKFFPRDTALVDITVSFIEAISGDKKKLESKGKVKFVAEEKEVQKEVDKEVADQLALAKFVKAQTEANIFAKSGNFAAAQASMNSLRGVMGVASVATQSIFGTASGYYADSFSYSSNANHAHSLNSAVRSGRGMSTGVKGMAGGSGVIGSNSVQMDMMNAFHDNSDALTDGNVSGNTATLTDNTNTSVSTSEEKRSLKKKRSQKEW
jgi:hypothetical protein